MNRSDTVYRHIGGSEEDGLFACGYMVKTPAKSQLDFRIPYFSIFVLLEGTGEYVDETGRLEELSRGSVVRRLPGLIHSTRVHSGEPWREFFISFGRGVFEYLLQLGLVDGTTAVSRCIVTPDLLRRFEELLAEMKTADSGALFGHLLAAQKIVAELYGQGSGNRFSPGIEKARELLSRELEKAISEREFAARLHVGYESLRKQFKKETGLSPMEYRRERRILTAKIMLLGGSTLKEAAAALGYCDGFTFAKQFKEKTGISPGRYRREGGA